MKKILAIILGSLLVMSFSCSKKQETLTFMHFWTSDEVKPVIEELAAEFEVLNPDIMIELIDLNWANGHDKITVAFATGSAADIIELGSDWVPEYAAKDLLHDLSGESMAYQDSLMGWDAALMDGKIYGFPWMLGTRVMFYNKNLMTQAGLNPKQPPSNWDELYSYCEKINKIGAPVYGFGSNSYEKFRLYKKFLPFLWSNHGMVLNADGHCALNSPDALYALQFYTKLSDIGYLESQRNLDDKFIAGELGFIISGDWLLRMMKANPPEFQVGACLIPAPIDNYQSASFLGGEFLTVNRDSKKKAEAVKFIKFLVSKNPDLKFNQAAGSITPSNIEASREILKKANPLAMVFLQQINYARPSPVHPHWVQIQSVLEDAIQKAIYHKNEISVILENACGEIEQILNEK